MRRLNVGTIKRGLVHSHVYSVNIFAFIFKPISVAVCRGQYCAEIFLLAQVQQVVFLLRVVLSG